MLVVFIIQLLNAVTIKCQMEGKIVDGDPVTVGRFTHSAFLLITLREYQFICGSSIINQRVLLTAAHCIVQCVNNYCRSGDAFIGDIDKYRGMKIPVKGFIIHEHYNNFPNVMNDIGLVSVRGQLQLGKFVKRVSIMKYPPRFDVASVAGWGFIDELRNIDTNYLYYAKQQIWPLKECRKVLHDVPNGSFCGSGFRGPQHPSVGDSGSALVADDYMQLGLVSFKRPEITQHLVVYTNVSFFYNWIKVNSRKLYCLSRN